MGDFWRMVWETNAHLVLMLTRECESSRVKVRACCARVIAVCARRDGKTQCAYAAHTVRSLLAERAHVRVCRLVDRRV
jgi:hypothetical protein